jgi:CTP:molybdopterin cytidylyltransferase MocA
VRRMTTAGLLLAAGAGRRMGTPKALVHDPDGASWLRRSVGALLDGGCDPVHVVLGAAADEARTLLADLAVEVVVADDWDEGMGASLRAGLLAVGDPDSVLVSLVDLPDVGSAVVARVLAAGTGRTTLARAAYDGVPGHPVLIGADHLAPLVETARGDVGARPYLAAHDVALVECGDLATGADRDTA